MISVAIATYNSEKYIIPQLESILKQSQKVDEVIIQDDYSKDKTIDIISEFINKNNLFNWKIEKNEHNLGYILTFKKAIKRCTGDIIILCDHDDVWLENKVEIISNTFKVNSDVQVLATSFVEIDENGKEINVKKRKGCSNNNLIRRKVKNGKINHMTFKDIAIYNISPGCTCAFRANIKEKLLEKEYNLPHDWQIEIIGMSMNGLYYLDVITTKYRIYSNNTIGLGHQEDYYKRVKLCSNGLSEKEEILRLINSLKSYDNKLKDIKYINKVIKAFRIRNKLMQTKNIIKYAPIAIFYSIGLNKLYESIGLDIITIIKSNKKKDNI